MIPYLFIYCAPYFFVVCYRRSIFLNLILAWLKIEISRSGRPRLFFLPKTASEPPTKKTPNFLTKTLIQESPDEWVDDIAGEEEDVEEAKVKRSVA